MKKLLLSISAFIFATTAFSQSAMNLANYEQVVSSEDNQMALESHITVENTSSNVLHLMVERTINTLATNHVEFFCTGLLCYAPGQGMSTYPDTVQPGLSSDFKAAVLPNGNYGYTSLHYRFWNQLNPSDSVGVDLDFQFSATGVHENKVTYGVGRPGLNPADAFTTLSYNLQSNQTQDKIVVLNMLGAVIKRTDVPGTNGVIVLNTSELQPGVYFVAYQNNGRLSDSYKLVVSHH